AVLLEHGHADLFRGAGVHRRLEDDDVALFERRPHGGAGLDERGEIGPVGGIDRGRHGDDEDLRLVQVCRVGCVAKVRGCSKFGWGRLEGVVAARLQLGDSRA
ncbi:hypothetical protein RZS08_66460, partial [Arthrospira platensis SPKY1]|nr:hypothetical protein [Arthrospira platensis SPKY1]